MISYQEDTMRDNREYRIEGRLVTDREWIAYWQEHRDEIPHLRCTDPDTLDRAAAIMADALRRRERDRAASLPGVNYGPPYWKPWDEINAQLEAPDAK